MSSARFRRASPQILSETLDGQAVVINLDSGVYYSLDLVGTQIWDALLAGADVDELGTALATRYTGPANEIAAAVDAFLAELQREGLVLPTDGDDARADLPPGGPGSARSPFSRPVLSRFDDIQELLLLDPIHEVEEAGWPAARDRGGEPPERA